MGALLVGVYETGTSSLLAESAPDSAKKLLKLLSAELNKTAVKDCPFVNLPATGRGLDPGLTAAEMKRCVWVKPIIISEVKFTEWTRDDRLRHPVFIGLREDKNPTELGSGRRVRGGDEQLILRKMLLHRRATADPSVPFELRAGGVVLASAMITSRALPSIFPFTDESMWQMI
jgi:ATP-dependent DNA ligase